MTVRKEGTALKYVIVLKKQAQKYLASVDKPTRTKLQKALERLSEFDGDIVPLTEPDTYRYKIEHYRILFRWRKNTIEIIVIKIDTRGNIKYRKGR